MFENRYFQHLYFNYVLATMSTSEYITGKDIYFENYYMLEFWQHLHYDIVGTPSMTIIFTCFNKHRSSTVVTVNERQLQSSASRFSDLQTHYCYDEHYYCYEHYCYDEHCCMFLLVKIVHAYEYYCLVVEL